MQACRGELRPSSGSGSIFIARNLRGTGSWPGTTSHSIPLNHCLSAAYDITNAEYLGEYRLRITFADGVVADIDLAERLRGKGGPMFAPLKDPAFFARVSVDRELGTIVWPNGADLAPDALHERAVTAR